MTESELNEIEARANAATPGPWVKDSNHGSDIYSGGTTDAVVQTDHGIYWRNDRALDGENFPEPYVPGPDQTFMMAARTDVPKLVAEIKRLRGLMASKSIMLINNPKGSGPVFHCIFCNEWSSGGASFSGQHSDDCPAFTPDGKVK